MKQKILLFLSTTLPLSLALFLAQIYAPSQFKPLTPRLLDYPHAVPTILQISHNIPRLSISSPTRNLSWLSSIFPQPILVARVDDCRFGKEDCAEIAKDTPSKTSNIKTQVYQEINKDEKFRYGYKVKDEETYVDKANGDTCTDGQGTISGTYCAPSGGRYNVAIESTQVAANEFTQKVAEKIVTLSETEIAKLSGTTLETACPEGDPACQVKVGNQIVYTLASDALIVKSDKIALSIATNWRENIKQNDFVNLSADDLKTKYQVDDVSQLIANLDPQDQTKLNSARQAQTVINDPSVSESSLTQNLQILVDLGYYSAEKIDSIKAEIQANQIKAFTDPGAKLTSLAGCPANNPGECRNLTWEEFLRGLGYDSDKVHTILTDRQTNITTQFKLNAFLDPTKSPLSHAQEEQGQTIESYLKNLGIDEKDIDTYIQARKDALADLALINDFANPLISDSELARRTCAGNHSCGEQFYRERYLTQLHNPAYAASAKSAYQLQLFEFSKLVGDDSFKDLPANIQNTLLNANTDVQQAFAAYSFEKNASPGTIVTPESSNQLALDFAKKIQSNPNIVKEYTSKFAENKQLYQGLIDTTRLFALTPGEKSSVVKAQLNDIGKTSLSTSFSNVATLDNPLTPSELKANAIDYAANSRGNIHLPAEQIQLANEYLDRQLVTETYKVGGGIPVGMIGFSAGMAACMPIAAALALPSGGSSGLILPICGAVGAISGALASQIPVGEMTATEIQDQKAAITNWTSTLGDNKNVTRSDEMVGSIAQSFLINPSAWGDEGMGRSITTRDNQFALYDAINSATDGQLISQIQANPMLQANLAIQGQVLNQSEKYQNRQEAWAVVSTFAIAPLTGALNVSVGSQLAKSFTGRAITESGFKALNVLSQAPTFAASTALNRVQTAAQFNSTGGDASLLTTPEQVAYQVCVMTLDPDSVECQKKLETVKTQIATNKEFAMDQAFVTDSLMQIYQTATSFRQSQAQFRAQIDYAESQGITTTNRTLAAITADLAHLNDPNLTAKLAAAELAGKPPSTARLPNAAELALLNVAEANKVVTDLEIVAKSTSGDGDVAKQVQANLAEARQNLTKAQSIYDALTPPVPVTTPITDVQLTKLQGVQSDPNTQLNTIPTTNLEGKPATRIDIDTINDSTIKSAATAFNKLIETFESAAGFALHPKQVVELLSPNQIIQLKTENGGSLAGKTDVIMRILSVSESRSLILAKGETEAVGYVNDQMLSDSGKKFYGSQNTKGIYLDSQRGYLEINFSKNKFDPADPTTYRQMNVDEVRGLLAQAKTDPSLHLTLVGDRPNTVWTRLFGNTIDQGAFFNLLGRNKPSAEGVLFKEITQSTQHGKFLIIADEISDDIRGNFAVSKKGMALKDVQDPSLLGGLKSGNEALSVYEDAISGSTHQILVKARIAELEVGQSKSTILRGASNGQSVPVDLDIHARALSEIIDQTLSTSKERNNPLRQQLADISTRLKETSTADAAITQLDTILSNNNKGDLAFDLSFRKASLQEDWNQLARVPDTDFGVEGKDLVLRKKSATTGERLSTATQLLSFYKQGKAMIDAFNPHLINSADTSQIPSLDSISIAPKGSQMDVATFYGELQAAGHQVRGLDATPQEALNALAINDTIKTKPLVPKNFGYGKATSEVITQFIQNRLKLFSKKASAIVLAGTNVDMDSDIKGILSTAHQNNADFDTLIITQYKQSPDGKTTAEYLQYQVKDGVIDHTKPPTNLGDAKTWNDTIQTQLKGSNPEKTLIIYKGRERAADLKVITDTHDNIRWSHLVDATGDELPTSVNIEQMWRRDRTFSEDFDLYLATPKEGLTADNVWNFFEDNLYTKMASDRFADTIKALGSAPSYAIDNLSNIGDTLNLGFFAKRKLTNLQTTLKQQASSFESMLATATSRQPLPSDQLVLELYSRAKATNDQLLDMANNIGKTLGLDDTQLARVKTQLGAEDNFVELTPFLTELNTVTKSLETPKSQSPQDLLLTYAHNNSFDPSSSPQYRVVTESHLASSGNTSTPHTAPVPTTPAQSPTLTTRLSDSIASLIQTPQNLLAAALRTASTIINPTIPVLDNQPITNILSQPDVTLSFLTSDDRTIALFRVNNTLYYQTDDSDPISLTTTADALSRLPSPGDISRIVLNDEDIDPSTYRAPTIAPDATLSETIIESTKDTFEDFLASILDPSSEEVEPAETTPIGETEPKWEKTQITGSQTGYITPYSYSLSDSDSAPTLHIDHNPGNNRPLAIFIPNDIPTTTLITVNGQTRQIGADWEILLDYGDTFTFGDTTIKIISDASDANNKRTYIDWALTPDPKMDLPTQLDNASKLTGTARRQAINAFLANLQTRYQTIIRFQNFLSQTIADNPNITRDEMLNLTLEEAQNSQLTNAEINNLLFSINALMLQHERIAMLKQEYQLDVNKMWSDAFGFYPQGKVEIQYSFSNINFISSDHTDFARAYKTVGNIASQQPIELTPDEVNTVINEVGGFHNDSGTLIPDTANIFNVDRIDQPLAVVIPHEDQHSFFTIVQLALAPNINNLTPQSGQDALLTQIVDLSSKLNPNTSFTRFENSSELNFTENEQDQITQAQQNKQSTYLIRPNEIIYYDPASSSELYYIYTGQNIAEFTSLLTKFSFNNRLEAETRVANEILAKIAGTQKTWKWKSWSSYKKNVVTQLQHNNYTYFVDSRTSPYDEIEQSLYIDIDSLLNQSLSISEPFRNYAIDKYYTADAQNELVKQAVDAYEALILKGYSHDEATILLQSSRLANWRSLARRLPDINPAPTILSRFTLPDFTEIGHNVATWLTNLLPPNPSKLPIGQVINRNNKYLKVIENNGKKSLLPVLPFLEDSLKLKTDYDTQRRLGHNLLKINYISSEKQYYYEKDDQNIRITPEGINFADGSHLYLDPTLGEIKLVWYTDTLFDLRNKLFVKYLNGKIIVDNDLSDKEYFFQWMKNDVVQTNSRTEIKVGDKITFPLGDESILTLTEDGYIFQNVFDQNRVNQEEYQYFEDKFAEYNTKEMADFVKKTLNNQGISLTYDTLTKEGLITPYGFDTLYNYQQERFVTKISGSREVITVRRVVLQYLIDKDPRILEIYKQSLANNYTLHDSTAITVPRRYDFEIKKLQEKAKQTPLTTQEAQYLSVAIKLKKMWELISTFAPDAIPYSQQILSEIDPTLTPQLEQVFAKLRNLKPTNDPLTQSYLTKDAAGFVSGDNIPGFLPLAEAFTWGHYVELAYGRLITPDNLVQSHQQSMTNFWNNYLTTHNLKLPDWMKIYIYRGDDLNFMTRANTAENNLANAGGNYFLRGDLSQDQLVHIINHEATHKIVHQSDSPRSSLNDSFVPIPSEEQHNEIVTELLAQMETSGNVNSYPLDNLELFATKYQEGARELISILQDIDTHQEVPMYGFNLLVRGLIDYNDGTASSPLEHVYQYYKTNLPNNQDFFDRLSNYTDTVYKSTTSGKAIVTPELLDDNGFTPPSAPTSQPNLITRTREWVGNETKNMILKYGFGVSTMSPQQINNKYQISFDTETAISTHNNSLENQKLRQDSPRILTPPNLAGDDLAERRAYIQNKIDRLQSSSGFIDIGNQLIDGDELIDLRSWDYEKIDKATAIRAWLNNIRIRANQLREIENTKRIADDRTDLLMPIPPIQLQILANERWPNAGSWVDGTMIINQSLINAMSTAGGLAGIVIHEFEHFVQRFDGSIVNLASIAAEEDDSSNKYLWAQRLGETDSDLVTAEYLRWLGFHPMSMDKALEDFIRFDEDAVDNIQDKDVIHGTLSERRSNIQKLAMSQEWGSSIIHHVATPLSWKIPIVMSWQDILSSIPLTRLNQILSNKEVPTELLPLINDVLHAQLHKTVEIAPDYNQKGRKTERSQHFADQLGIPIGKNDAENIAIGLKYWQQYREAQDLWFNWVFSDQLSTLSDVEKTLLKVAAFYTDYDILKDYNTSDFIKMSQDHNPVLQKIGSDIISDLHTKELFNPAIFTLLQDTKEMTRLEAPFAISSELWNYRQPPFISSIFVKWTTQLLNNWDLKSQMTDQSFPGSLQAQSDINSLLIEQLVSGKYGDIGSHGTINYDVIDSTSGQIKSLRSLLMSLRRQQYAIVLYNNPDSWFKTGDDNPYNEKLAELYYQDLKTWIRLDQNLDIATLDSIEQKEQLYQEYLNLPYDLKPTTKTQYDQYLRNKLGLSLFTSLDQEFRSIINTNESNRETVLRVFLDKISDSKQSSNPFTLNNLFSDVFIIDSQSLTKNHDWVWSVIEEWWNNHLQIYLKNNNTYIYDNDLRDMLFLADFIIKHGQDKDSLSGHNDQDTSKQYWQTVSKTEAERVRSAWIKQLDTIEQIYIKPYLSTTNSDYIGVMPAIIAGVLRPHLNYIFGQGWYLESQLFAEYQKKRFTDLQNSITTNPSRINLDNMTAYLKDTSSIVQSQQSILKNIRGTYLPAKPLDPGDSFSEKQYIQPLFKMFWDRIATLSTYVHNLTWDKAGDIKSPTNQANLEALEALYVYVTQIPNIRSDEKEVWLEQIAKRAVVEAPFEIALEFVAKHYEAAGSATVSPDESIIRLFGETWGKTDAQYQAIEKRLPDVINKAVAGQMAEDTGKALDTEQFVDSAIASPELYRELLSAGINGSIEKFVAGVIGSMWKNENLFDPLNQAIIRDGNWPSVYDKYGNHVLLPEVIQYLYQLTSSQKFTLISKILGDDKGLLTNPKEKQGMSKEDNSTFLNNLIKQNVDGDKKVKNMMGWTVDFLLSNITYKPLAEMAIAQTLQPGFFSNPDEQYGAAKRGAILWKLRFDNIAESFNVSKFFGGTKEELGRGFANIKRGPAYDSFIQEQTTLVKNALDIFGIKPEDESSSSFISWVKFKTTGKAQQKISGEKGLIQMGSALGVVGMRALQTINQFVKLPDSYASEARKAYDQASPYPMLTAFKFIRERIASNKEEIQQLKLQRDSSQIEIAALEQMNKELNSILNNVEIVRKVGGGSIVTVYEAIWKPSGQHIVLKVTNPNILQFVRQNTQFLKDLITSLKSNDPDNAHAYEMVYRLSGTMESWVTADVLDQDFKKFDPLFTAQYNNYQASNGVDVGYSHALDIYNEQTKLEEYIAGETLNSYSDPEKLSELPPDQFSKRKANIKLAVDAVVEDYFRHLQNPVTVDGREVYIAHSDLHPGNVIVQEDSSGVHLKLIDRSYYLILEATDKPFIDLMLGKHSTENIALPNVWWTKGPLVPVMQDLMSLINYFTNLPGNEKLKGQETSLLTQIVEKEIFSDLPYWISHRNDPQLGLDTFNLVSRVLEEEGVKLGMPSDQSPIPLRIRILVKNMISISGMLQNNNGEPIATLRDKATSTFTTSLPPSSNLLAIYNNEKYTTLYRYENPNQEYNAQREGEVSTIDTIGTWFTDNLASLQTYTFSRINGVEGGRFVLIRIPTSDLPKYKATNNPTTADMDTEPDNYVIPIELQKSTRLTITAPFKASWKDKKTLPWQDRNYVKDFIQNNLSPDAITNLLSQQSLPIQSTSLPQEAILLGKINPSTLTKSEFENNPEILFHGHDDNFTFSRDYDYLNRAQDNSTTLGYGFYATPDKKDAELFSIAFGASTPNVTQVLPYQAKMYDFRDKSNPQTNTLVPSELVNKYIDYYNTLFSATWGNYQPDNQPYNRIYSSAKRYKDTLESFRSKDIDFRAMLSLGGDPRYSEYASEYIRDFMLSQGYDGVIYVEGGDHPDHQKPVSYVFYNLDVVGDYQTWQSPKLASTPKTLSIRARDWLQSLRGQSLQVANPEFNQRPENQAPQIVTLTWEKLIEIEQENIGLRHVSTLAEAKNESENGFTGDSLSISSLEQFVNKYYPEKLPKQLFGLGLLSQINLTTQEKETILLTYEEALKEFVTESVGMDLNRIANDKVTISTIIERMRKSTTFLLIDQVDKILPSDQSVYFGLGKTGRKAIQSSQIKSIVSPEIISLEQLYFTNEELDQPMSRESFSKLQSSIASLFVDQILSNITSQATSDPSHNLPNELKNSIDSDDTHKTRAQISVVLGTFIYIGSELAQLLRFTKTIDGTMYDSLMLWLQKIFGDSILNNYNFLRWNLNNVGFGLIIAPLIHLLISQVIPKLLGKQYQTSLKNKLWIAIIPITIIVGAIIETITPPGGDVSKYIFDPNDLQAFIAGVGIYWASTFTYYIVSTIFRYLRVLSTQ